jgi:hypothetical protein
VTDADIGEPVRTVVADRNVAGVGGFTYNFKNPDTQYQSGIEPCRLRLPIPPGLGASATAAVSHPSELPG